VIRRCPENQHRRFFVVPFIAMAFPRTALHQTIAAFVAVAIALGGYFWGTHLAGRAGVLILVVSVPAGVFFGWLTGKLFEFADDLLDE
jgi:hypothetical protein